MHLWYQYIVCILAIAAIDHFGQNLKWHPNLDPIELAHVYARVCARVLFLALHFYFELMALFYEQFELQTSTFIC